MNDIKQRGGPRKNAGQAADLPPGERVQSYRLTLDTETIAIFKTLGGAKQNISRGARAAARIAADCIKKPPPS
jgi:hypothetical protein